RALFRIAENSFNHSQGGVQGFEALAGLIDGCDCYDFRYGNLDDAVAIFDSLAHSAIPPKPAGPIAPERIALRTGPEEPRPRLRAVARAGEPVLLRAFRDPECLPDLDVPSWDLLLRNARHASVLGRLGALVEARGVVGDLPERQQSQLRAAQSLSAHYARL